MFRNYLLIALRNFKRQKLFSLLEYFWACLWDSRAPFLFFYM